MGQIYAAQIHGMEAQLFPVDGVYSQGYSGFQIVGNIAKICNDGSERAKAALESCGYTIPAKKIVISIAPAEIRKDGSQYDLPLAISIYRLIEEKPSPLFSEDWLFAAELSLSGDLRPIKGVIPFALAAAKSGVHGMVVAAENLPEISLLKHLAPHYFSKIKIVGAHLLKEVIDFARGLQPLIEPPMLGMAPTAREEDSVNFDDMVLNDNLEMAAVVTAVGRHNVLLRGVPGSGKSMWARRIQSILPPLSTSDHLDVLMLHSIHCARPQLSILRGRPPSRAPHHQASSAALLGGIDQPGELSLAHRGVLFLDELPEFRRDFIESLREPLETGVVNLSRSSAKLRWQAEIMLIAAFNNCPCGWFGSSQGLCRCPLYSVMSYQKKISGPFLDRVDIHLYFDKAVADSMDLFQHTTSHTSNTLRMKDKVARALDFSRKRNEGIHVRFNSEIGSDQLFAAAGNSEGEFKKLAKENFSKKLSTRSQIRLLRVARTIADVEQCNQIKDSHLKQALDWHYQAHQHLVQFQG